MMITLDLGKNTTEQDRSIILVILCLTIGILSADLLIPLGFVIWILYLVPLLMSVWISHRYAPFFIAWLLTCALLLGSLISGAALSDTSDLSNRAIFILMIAIVALLAWEIKNNYAYIEEENIERRAAQERLEVLAGTLEERVASRTKELSDVNTQLTRDIEERRRVETALATSNQKLKLLSQITRHDISNRVFALFVDLDLIRERVAETKDTVIIERVDSMDRIAHGIQAQIAFTRDYQEIGSQAPDWFRVKFLILNAAEQLDTGIVHTDKDLEALEIFADPLIGKVFYNLIDNAIRHGGGHVSRISFSSLAKDGGIILVCEDNGCGVPDGNKEHIFQKGFGRDSGLGLFLIHEILAITGITIRENGKSGSGARFEIAIGTGKFRQAVT